MSRKGKKKHAEEEGGEAWLLPYSDLMTLLLAVFIVLFAVSKLDETKAKELAAEFRENVMTESGGYIFPDGSQSPVPPIFDENQEVIPQEELDEYFNKNELENLDELKSKLDAIFENGNMNTDISTSIDTRGLVITLNNAILFESGSAEIKSENENTLKQIAEAVDSLDNFIRIEGHTDNVPINSVVYPSNWELSTARAASVVRLFINECNVSPEKVVAVGYGEYKPIADNSTTEGRAKNRRIDIIILSEKYNNLEN